MSDARRDWQDVLAATPECIDPARFGTELDPASEAHLTTCARCQAELALFREITAEESSAEEDEAARWIAGELERRHVDSAKVVPFRKRPMRVLYSLAAALLILIGAGWWLQLRDPSLGQLESGDLYRSTRVELLAPAGDLEQAPNELRWTAVPNASRYHVRIVEVDGNEIWSSDTTQPHASLPSAVIAQFAPGKSLIWDVRAFRGEEMLAASETQTVRVAVAPVRNTP